MDVDGILLDMDGVLTVSWRALPGAAETLAWLRTRPLPFRLVTNTTTHTRADLAASLGEAGIEVQPEEVVTAVVATAAYLRANHPGARVRVLSDGDAVPDMEGVRLVDRDPEVVVLGGAFSGFSYEALNEIFRSLMDGAALVAMHRNMYWRTDAGWQLDGGAYVAGLEEASGRRATVCGKPSAAFFRSALSTMGVDPTRAVMVGDDVSSDVLGGQATGVHGVLVRTGKFRPEDLDGAPGEPDHVIDSIADLPGLLEGA